MANLGIVKPSEQGTSVQATELASPYVDGYGRAFHYAYDTTAVGRGYMAVAAATIANHNSMSLATANVVGDTYFDVTLGGTAATKDQYKDGWLTVNDGLGEGRTYPIEGHEAQATTTGDLIVDLAEQIDTVSAISASNIDLTYNLYDELRVADTNQTFVPVGVPICVGGLGAAEYGYVQTWGPCAVFHDEAPAALGEDMTLGAGTGAGQVEGKDGAAEPFVGTDGPTTAVADEYQLMYLKLDPGVGA